VTLALPTLLTNTTAAATATFTSPAAGSLLVVHARRNNLATTTVITVSAANGTGGAGAYTKVVEAGPGDPASSERAVVFYKVSTGDETSITLTDMSGGTRLIEVYSVAVPVGAGGAWRVLSSATQSTAVAGLTDLASADVTSECTDSIAFAQSIYSSSVTAGNEGTWPGFTTRETSNRFNGSTGVLLLNGKGTFNNTFTWALDTRRAAGTHVAFGYVVVPSVTVTNPPATGGLYGIQSLQASVSGGNTTVAQVQWWRDIAVDTQIGSDTTSPYSSGNVVAFKVHNGSAWTNVTAVKVHNGTAWIQVYP
jgi:hypothetical protein